VELDNIHIEGLVHVTALRNDYYHFDNIGHSLTGERTGESFHLGDRVHVQVASVDMENHRIDLQLLEMVQKNKASAPVPKRKRSIKKKKASGNVTKKPNAEKESNSSRKTRNSRKKKPAGNKRRKK